MLAIELPHNVGIIEFTLRVQSSEIFDTVDQSVVIQTLAERLDADKTQGTEKVSRGET